MTLPLSKKPPARWGAGKHPPVSDCDILHQRQNIEPKERRVPMSALTGDCRPSCDDDQALSGKLFAWRPRVRDLCPEDVRLGWVCEQLGQLGQTLS